MAAAPVVVHCDVQDFTKDAAMFEWAGVGLGKDESYHISASLRKLAIDIPALERIRFWGKILGTEGDYYIAEGKIKESGVAPPVGLPGSPEDDVEPRGEGANAFTYWASSSPSGPWVRLPAARGSHIAAARKIKRLLTGKLSNAVPTCPEFQRSELHLLRSQIARITSSCTLAVKGWYEAAEEGKNKIKEVEDPAGAFPSNEELATQEGWTHAAPFLLPTGKSTWPDTEGLDEKIGEEALQALQERIEKDPEKGMLEPISGDLEEVKPEDAEGSPAWAIKVFGDQTVYDLGGNSKSYAVTAVRSLLWPGAVTVAQGKRFANLYVGYATKCGQLVPPLKDSIGGLVPVRSTLALLPVAPEDIQDEPEDLEEQEAPAQQDDAVSDKGDLDPEDA